MKKMNKKGFTIVELVIVIAVIAILAAVMIPTFGGIIERANQSSAKQEAALAYKAAYAIDVADGKVDGKKNETDDITAADIAADITVTADTVIEYEFGADGKMTKFTYENADYTVESADGLNWTATAKSAS